jgi:predicted protein tyrosine phosphatase
VTAKIVVCPFDRVEELVASRSPVRIVSLLDPESVGPYVGPGYGSRHLRLSFHDVEVGTFDEEPPTATDVAALLTFVMAWQGRGLLLIHCRAGVSRSPAAAFAAACALRPTSSELELARALRRAAPFVRPNRALLRLADEALSRQGRMLRALEQTEHEAADEEPVIPFELEV